MIIWKLVNITKYWITKKYMANENNMNLKTKFFILNIANLHIILTLNDSILLNKYYKHQ